MKILVFGASGATGRELVQQALAQNHDVAAFVRSPGKLNLQHPRLSVVQGDVADAGAVTRAVQGQDAVLSALGVARPLHPDPIVVGGVGHIVSAMEQTGVRRFVYLSFIGVKASRIDAGFVIKHVVARVVRHEIADHETKEDLSRRSRLAWTIVRPPKLTNGPLTGVYRCGEHVAARSLLPMLSRADVAQAMLRVLSDDAFIGKAVNLLPGSDPVPTPHGCEAAGSGGGLGKNPVLTAKQK